MQIAVIIPTLNEEQTLGTLLGDLADQLKDTDQLIVVDGGSSDRTLAEAGSARVLRTGPGRGQQLDAGARCAINNGADLLIFLHADSRAPANLLDQLRTLKPAIGGGCLVEFIGADGLLGVGQRLVNWRTQRFKRPLGDQAQFATHSAYLESGGYPAWPILEDTEFIDRLRKLGELDIVPTSIGTSSRRFRARGTVRTVLNNWLIWTLFRLGVSPHRLVRLYRSSDAGSG